MNHSNRHAESSATITLGDVYSVIFRHKWKIIFLSLAGIVAAIAFYVLNPPLYQSEAELFIRYITDSRPVTAPVDNATMTAPGGGQSGAVIINSEIKILTSFDLAQQVANAVGPEKILAKVGGGKDPIQAAAMVRGGLIVAVSYNSSVIDVVFQHPDPTVVQPVLNEVIAEYLNKHAEIHQVLGTGDDSLTEATTQLHSQIAQTEQEMLNINTNAGIVSVEDEKKTVTEQISKVRQQIFDVEQQIEISQGMPVKTDVVSSVQQPMTNMPVVEMPSEQTDEYNKLCVRLSNLQKKKDEFLAQGYTEDGVLGKDISDQIATAKELKKNLEEKYPELARVAAVMPGPDGQPAASAEEAAQTLTLLQTKDRVLNEQLERLRVQSVAISAAEPKILDLQLKNQNQEETLQHFLKSVADARINETLEAGKISNISTIQKPTPPSPADTKRLKMVGMLLAGGIFGGLALAFLIDMVLDRSIKRPTEIENKLKIPLFLSIPNVRRNGSRRLAKRRQLQIKNTEGAAMETSNGESSGKNGNLEIAPWSANHALRAFSEALRDRIVVHFETNGLTRKPKLVAVTSANRGAGVTTIATGLAASLSETGEGNVLLVDMNLEQGAVQQFYQGKPGCPLDDAFEHEKRSGAMMQDNLYVVSDSSNGDKLPRIMPKRFSSLLPKFKASDYDYIIFDMPAVTQTSVTARLAGHMDMVVLVVEAEKTSLEVVRRANSLLAESKANVTAVLNKAHNYVPEKLHQEFLSDS